MRATTHESESEKHAARALARAGPRKIAKVKCNNGRHQESLREKKTIEDERKRKRPERCAFSIVRLHDVLDLDLLGCYMNTPYETQAHTPTTLKHTPT